MTNSKTIKTTPAPRTAAARKSPAASAVGLPTLLLAAVIALEVAGMRALPEAPADMQAVAALDGATMEGPARRLHAAPVEVRIVAQADGFVH